MKNSWVQDQARFDFLLGEFYLFSVKLDVLRWNGHFTELNENIYEDVSRLEMMPPNGSAAIPSCPVRHYLPRLQISRPFLRYAPTQYWHYYIDLRSGSFDEYLRTFSSKSRSTLLRKVRKFQTLSAGRIAWQEFSSVDDILTFHQVAKEISRKTYQERLLKAGLPEDLDFREGLVDSARQGKVRGYILFRDERPIAYMCCPIVDGVVFYQYVGYDPEFRDWSPGIVLQYLVLERLFGEKQLIIFDFTPGEGAHKKFFGTSSMFCADIYFFRATLHNMMVVLMHSGFCMMSRGISNALSKIGVKSMLKKWFRYQQW